MWSPITRLAATPHFLLRRAPEPLRDLRLPSRCRRAAVPLRPDDAGERPAIGYGGSPTPSRSLRARARPVPPHDRPWRLGRGRTERVVAARRPPVPARGRDALSGDPPPRTPDRP